MKLTILFFLVALCSSVSQAQSVTVPGGYFGYSTTNCVGCPVSGANGPGTEGWDPGSLTANNGTNPVIPGLLTEGKLFPHNEIYYLLPPRGPDYAATVTNFAGFEGPQTGMNYMLFHTTATTRDFSVWEYPPWMLCFNYTTIPSANGYFHGPPQDGGTPCTDAVDPGGYNDGVCHYTNAAGGGRCPGPTQQQLASTTTNVGGVTVHNGIPYDVMQAACNAVVWAELQGKPFAFVETTVEPNIGGQWVQSSATYSDVIIQAYYVEEAILHGFSATVDGVSLGCRGLANPADAPTFLGPSISSVPTSITVTNINAFYNPNSCVDGLAQLGGGTTNVCAITVWPNVADFHLYLGGIEPPPGGLLPPGVTGCPTPSSRYVTASACTGGGLIAAIADRVAAYKAVGINKVYQTEGSYAQQGNIALPNDTEVSAQLDTAAFLMDYMLGGILAGLQQDIWFSIPGNAYVNSPDFYGTLSNTAGANPPPGATMPAGIAYGTLIAWLGPQGTSKTGATINTTCAIAGGCLDQEGSKWAYTLTEANGTQAYYARVYSVLAPHATGTYTFPAGYNQYRDYTNKVTTFTSGQPVPLTVVPILVEQGATPAPPPVAPPSGRLPIARYP